MFPAGEYLDLKSAAVIPQIPQLVTSITSQAVYLFPDMILLEVLRQVEFAVKESNIRVDKFCGHALVVLQFCNVLFFLSLSPNC